MKTAVETVIDEWLARWIVGENLCPFARPVLNKNSYRVKICDATSWSAILDTLFDECRRLEQDNSVDTTLFVLSETATDFYEYLGLLESSEKLIERENWEGVFQLASFHPDYLFEGEPEDSVTHYSNRSPLPILHILREEQISKVMMSDDDAHLIVTRNQQHLQKIGIDAVRAQLQTWISRLKDSHFQ